MNDYRLTRTGRKTSPFFSNFVGTNFFHLLLLFQSPHSLLENAEYITETKRNRAEYTVAVSSVGAVTCWVYSRKWWVVDTYTCESLGMKFLREIQTRHHARENCNIRTISVFVPKNPRTIHPQSYASGLVTTSKDVYAIWYERNTSSNATGGKKRDK